MSGQGRIYTTESGEPVHGMMAEFTTPASVYHAAEKFRDAGYTKWDVHTPFPIHGMEDAMGIRRTRLPMLVALVGLTGASLGLLLQWWVATRGYAVVTQGKPYFSWQAFVPITFELGVLSAAFTALIGMLATNGLPRHHHPLLKKERFLNTSQDTFILAVEARDPKFDPDGTRRLLEACGGSNIDLVED